MTPAFSRRAILTLPLLISACGGDEPAAPPRRDFPRLSFSYLPPIPLNIQRLEVAEDFVRPTGDGELADGFAMEAILGMARDRLKPMGTGGMGRFRILAASIALRRDTLTGVLAVRLDVRNDDDTNNGVAEARVTSTKTGSIGDRRGAAYDMLKSLMDDLNVELEYQIRSKLRTWIHEPASPGATPAPMPPR